MIRRHGLLYSQLTLEQSRASSFSPPLSELALIFYKYQVINLQISTLHFPPHHGLVALPPQSPCRHHFPAHILQQLDIAHTMLPSLLPLLHLPTTPCLSGGLRMLQAPRGEPCPHRNLHRTRTHHLPKQPEGGRLLHPHPPQVRHRRRHRRPTLSSVPTSQSKPQVCRRRSSPRHLLRHRLPLRQDPGQSRRDQRTRR